MILAAVLGFAVAANATSYTISDEAIDALVENAIEVSSVSEMSAALGSAASAGAVITSGTEDVIAIALCFVLGGLGIHRHYMGTSSWMWAAYLFTCGGIFGVVPLVDFIVMILKVVDQSGLGQFYGSTKFLMWL